MKYAADVGVALLERELKALVIPDMGGEQDIKVGTAHWNVSRLDITTVKVSDYFLEPDNGGRLNLLVSGIDVDASGRVSGGVTTCFPYPCGLKICRKCKQTFDMGVLGIKVSLRDVMVYLDLDINVKDRKPHLVNKACSVRIPTLNVKLSHSILNALLNTIAPILKKALLPSVQKNVCGEAALIRAANNFLMKFPDSQVIDNFARINYEFLEVSGNEKYLDLVLRGEFQKIHNPQLSQLPLIDFPTNSNSNKMLYVWVSDRTLNTFGEIFHQEGLLQVVVNGNTPQLPSVVKVFLNTNLLWFGFPQLAWKYPNRPMQFRVSTYKQPTFHFSPDGAAARIYVALDFEVILKDGSLFRAFFIKLDIDAKGEVALSQGATKVSAKINSFRFGGQIGGYTLGKFSLGMDSLAVKGLAKLIVWLANPTLEKGFPLPSMPQLKVRNEKLEFVQNAVRVEADFELNV